VSKTYSEVDRPGADAAAGFVFATTGSEYTAMARSAVRSLRQAMPNANVDLFTDQILDDSAFDAIHTLETVWFRPKMEALRRSRFERTVMLDADVIVRHDISEVFDVLKRFDAAGVQMIRTNQGVSLHTTEVHVPACFPQINGGLIGIRRSKATDELIERWESKVRESNAFLDQPTLRELLWASDLRFHVLPSQYNMMSQSLIRHWDTSMASPRVLHISEIGPPYDGDPSKPYDLAAIVGEPMALHLLSLDAADVTLGGGSVTQNATHSERASKPAYSRMLKTLRRASGLGLRQKKQA